MVRGAGQEHHGNQGLVVYGSAIEFDDVGLAHGDGPRRSRAFGGRLRAITRSTAEKFRVVLHKCEPDDVCVSPGAPEPSTVSVEVIHINQDVDSNDGGDGDDGDDGLVACDGAEDEAEAEAEDDESLLMAELARMGLPLGFGRGLGCDDGDDGDGGVGGVGAVAAARVGGHLSEPSSQSHIRFMDADVEVHEDNLGHCGTSPPHAAPRRTVRVKKKNPKKYWLQRYSLFSLYDNGILIDDEGWYSVTPEVIAWHHASMIVRANGHGCVVYDMFGGVGGNAIQLALAGCHVLVTEICPDKAYMIRNNARVYGVQDRVEVLVGDAMQVAPRLRPGLVDAVLMSPPWGGPEYSKDCMFDVQDMGGYPELGVGRLLRVAVGNLGASSVVLWLPRTTNLEQLGIELAKLGGNVRCHVELAKINGIEKAITAYIGTEQRIRQNIALLVGKLHAEPGS